MPEVAYADDQKLSIIQRAWFGYDSLEEAKDNYESSSTAYYNVNIETGKEIKLDEIIDIDEAAEKIYNKDATIVKNPNNLTLDNYLEKVEYDLDRIKDSLTDSTFFTFDENEGVIIHLSCSGGTMEV